MSDKFPKEVPIPDLTRPNYGDKDEDVTTTQSSIITAEIKHEASLNAEFFKDAPIKDLRRHDYGVDSDIVATKASLN